MSKISNFHNSARQRASIWLALVLIATGSISLPFTVNATTPAELGEADISTVCGARGTDTLLGSWTHNNTLGFNPHSGLDSKWGTVSPYTTTGVTSAIPGGMTATDLSAVPVANSESHYLAYPFTTGANTRITISEITYGDSVATAINFQAKLFAIESGVPREVTGAATAALVTTTSAGYVAETFDFPDTLLASNTSYEMRLFVWNDTSTISGFDDFGIKFQSCLPSAPTISGVTTTSTTASVAFTAPTITGGSDITNYEYSIDSGATWLTRSPEATTSPLSITGLAEESSPLIKIRAVTAAGSGVASEVSSPSTPSGPQSIENTGFESDLTGWLSGGGVTVVPGPITLQSGSNTWVYGVHQTKSGRLQPTSGSSTFANDLQTNLALSSSEDTALRASFVGNPTNIAWITREVTLQSGTTYRMAWNYTSTDYVPFNDGSITTLVPVSVQGTPTVTINNSVTNNRWALLGFTNPGTGMYSTGDYGSTGWQFATYTVSESGTYKLGFASFNIGDTALSPVLLLDDNLGTVTKNGQAFSPVPPNDPTAPSLAQSISPNTQTLNATTGSAITSTTAFTASGLVGAVTYAITSGTLPEGLSLDSSTGVISGTPTSKASGSVTITATGSTSGTAAATVTYSVKDAQAPLTITSTSGVPGTELTLLTSGGSGTGNITFTVTDGTATGCSVSNGKLTATSAGTCLVTATKAGDSDYDPVSSVQATVTFANPSVSSVPVLPTPTPSPVQTQTPAPQPTSAPVQSVPLVPTVPTPTPSSTLGPVNLIPTLEPTPGVVYGSTNPIPQILVDLLSKPLAYVLEQLTGSPLLPKLTPSESLAYENGSLVETQLVKTDNENGYLLIGDGWQVALEATDTSGEPLRLDDSGNIILNSDRFVQFSGNGFAPGSIVKVWLFSDPTELSDVIADANGNFVGESLIPEGIPTGEHTIQLNGLTKDGQLRSVALGVLIQPELVIAPAAPVGFDLSGLMNLLWILAALVASVFFFILWRRRKKKDEEDSPITSGDSGDLIFASEGFEPSQQFPNDSRRKIGAGSPPNRKRFTFKPKGA